MVPPGSDPALGRRICSARGCRRPATYGLLWNNPRLHEPTRRKVWTACPDHRESLASFLAARGFLRAAVPLGDLPQALEAAEEQRDWPS